MIPWYGYGKDSIWYGHGDTPLLENLRCDTTRTCQLTNIKKNFKIYVIGVFMLKDE